MIQQQLYCSIRKQWVAAIPEEHVRQNLLAKMTAQLGFPPSSIVIEKSLKQMPHLALLDHAFPERRADLVCFAKGIHRNHQLYPLLLIECKATLLNQKVISQVAGYNHFMQAYFICIANADEIRTGWLDPTSKQYQFINHLPTYSELMQAIKNHRDHREHREN